jgi:hypothetical protein
MKQVISTEIKDNFSTELRVLNADLRLIIQEGIDSGVAIPADQVFAELNSRYGVAKCAVPPAPTIFST